MTQYLHVVFNPLLPWVVLAFVGAGCASLGLVGLVRRARGSILRLIAFALMGLLLANPSLVDEQREPLHDTVVVAIDDSPSTFIGNRRAQIEKAVGDLTDRLKKEGDLDIETLHINGTEETDLFQALSPKLTTTPKDRLAGIIAITDGQIHDKPQASLTAPFHAFIAGNHDEVDRRLSIKEAPAYGIVGKKITLVVRVDDAPSIQSENAPVTFSRDDGSRQTVMVPVGKDIPIDVSIDHAGQNLFAFETPSIKDEITALNNTAAVTVNGIRDRLRVLLVSGEPHIGGRTWRNFLKADPAVDLVHFTILRSPTKENFVPNSQLALITFPVHELFDVKLKSFDLVIFDRFSNRSLVPDEYLDNIAQYVEDGGSLLISNATDDGASSALSDTPLSRLLPTQPTGQILSGSFVPDVTETGRRHPVTALLEAAMPRSTWGPWYRQTATTSPKGDVLLAGINGQPLLVLNHAGKGRVAQFLTDQFWLWGRGYGGGGPQAELLRRVAHWLVQEPELDETALRAHSEFTPDGWQLVVTKQSLHETVANVSVIDSKGGSTTLTLNRSAQQGLLMATVLLKDTGLYHVKEGDSEILVMVGPTHAPEFGDMIATQAKLENVTKSTGGGVFWLQDQPSGPEIRRTNGEGPHEGAHWAGLRRNGQYKIVGSQTQPLWPAWAVLSMLLLIVMMAWRREGHGKN